MCKYTQEYSAKTIIKRKLLYNLLTHNSICHSHDQKSSIIVYQLQCTKSSIFYWRETGQMLLMRLNGHWSIRATSNSELPVPTHSKSNQIPFQESWSTCATQNPGNQTWLHPLQYETTYQLSSKQSFDINIFYNIPPDSLPHY